MELQLLTKVEMRNLVRQLGQQVHCIRRSLSISFAYSGSEIYCMFRN